MKSDSKPPSRTPTRGLVSWALFDWANSPVSILIITFVFSVYFSREIVGDEVRGQALWGYAVGISGLLVAILSPILGAIADIGGRRKPWIFVFTVLCVIGAGMLWFAEPNPAFILWAMIWSIIAKIGFEFSVVFNNAMLPDLVERNRLGRWSGWAWGLGYLGALAALGLVLVGFVLTDSPWFGLDKGESEHVRAVGPLVAAWFVIFAWPLFVWTPDRPAQPTGIGPAVAQGLSSLVMTLANLRSQANIARFLLARMIYADGLITIFAIGVIYGAATFGTSASDVVFFGILVNGAAGLGALGFAWIDDWLGSRRTVMIGLGGILVAGTIALLARDMLWFWLAGALLGLFAGPSQAASRSLMAHLTPPELRTQFFGLYAFSGKATAFLGPVLAGLVTEATASQWAGLATALIFIAVGLGLLLLVRDPVDDAQPEEFG